MDRLVNLDDYERAAKLRLETMAYDYFAGGANDEVTLRQNRDAFAALAIRYRVLVDIAQRSLGTTVLGAPVAFPVLVAPTAMQKLAHPDGELAMARAAAALGTLMVVSTTATTSLEDVAAATNAPKWFQVYLYKDREASREMLERVAVSGYRALVLTVDTPLLGRRERDVRNEFRLPDDLVIANAVRVGQGGMPGESGRSGLSLHLSRLHDDRLTPKDIEWLASFTKLPVLVKGVVRGDDAARCLDHGAAGIVVSNHGGRQLDTAIPTIRALPEVVDRVAGRAEVYLDGGVRRGTDVLKALALGARAVLVGRPALWGLAVAGEEGVKSALGMLRDEFDLACALSGCTSVAECTRDLIVA